MKNLFLSILAALLVSCGNSNSSPESKPETVKKEPQVNAEEVKLVNSKPISGEEILALLEDLGDYSESNETLKLLESNDSTVHIQISPIIAAGTSKKVMIEDVKHSIIYTSILCFSYSEIDEIKITSNPLEMEFEVPGNIKTVKYRQLDKLKKTASLNRKKVLGAIKSKTGITDFGKLYDTSYGLKGVPNSTMKALIYDMGFYDEISN